MTTKWLKEAESEIIDTIMWGGNFHGHDITKVLDGEVIDDLLLLLVSRKQDEAMDWLKHRVIYYVQNHEELIEMYRDDEEERMRDNAIDCKREMAEAV